MKVLFFLFQLCRLRSELSSATSAAESRLEELGRRAAESRRAAAAASAKVAAAARALDSVARECEKVSVKLCGKLRGFKMILFKNQVDCENRVLRARLRERSRAKQQQRSSQVCGEKGILQKTRA